MTDPMVRRACSTCAWLVERLATSGNLCGHPKACITIARGKGETRQVAHRVYTAAEARAAEQLCGRSGALWRQRIPP